MVKKRPGATTWQDYNVPHVKFPSLDMCFVFTSVDASPHADIAELFKNTTLPSLLFAVTRQHNQPCEQKSLPAQYLFIKILDRYLFRFVEHNNHFAFVESDHWFFRCVIQ